MNDLTEVHDAIVAALTKPAFLAIASEQSGSFLRQCIANQLLNSGVNVTVVAAEAIGQTAPFAGAEIVWQLPFGGEFQHQVVGWDERSPYLAIFEDDVGTTHMFAQCRSCGQRNELVLEGTARLSEVTCSGCGTPIRKS